MFVKQSSVDESIKNIKTIENPNNQRPNNNQKKHFLEFCNNNLKTEKEIEYSNNDKLLYSYVNII